MIINIKQSGILNGFVLTTHAGALGVVLLLPALPGIQAALVSVIAASLWRQLSSLRLAAPIELELRTDGLCLLQGRDERQLFAGNLVAAYIHPGFVRLILKATGHRSRVLLVTRDAVEAGAYRELRAAIVQGRFPPDQAAA